MGVASPFQILFVFFFPRFFRHLNETLSPQKNSLSGMNLPVGVASGKALFLSCFLFPSPNFLGPPLCFQQHNQTNKPTHGRFLPFFLLRVGPLRVGLLYLCLPSLIGLVEYFGERSSIIPACILELRGMLPPAWPMFSLPYAPFL